MPCESHLYSKFILIPIIASTSINAMAQMASTRTAAIAIGASYNRLSLGRGDSNPDSLVFADDVYRKNPLKGYGVDLAYHRRFFKLGLLNIAAETGVRWFHSNKSDSYTVEDGQELSRTLSLSQYTLFAAPLLVFDLGLFEFHMGAGYDMGFYGDASSQMKYTPAVENSSTVNIEYEVTSYTMSTALVRVAFSMIDLEYTYQLSNFRVKQLSAQVNGGDVFVTNDPNDGKMLSMSGSTLRIRYSYYFGG